MLIYLCIIFGLPTFFLALEFISFLFTGRRLYSKPQILILEIAGMLFLPLFYLGFFDESANDCCSDSATFSPEHKPTIYLLIFLCIAAYFYSSLKDRITIPVVEVLINVLLLFGFVLNIFIGIHIGDIYWLFGNIPVGILLLFRMIENHRLFLEHHQIHTIEPDNFFEKIAWKILSLHPWLKLPMLFLLCLPVFTVITSLLMLFGQKPDAIVRAFTDTYKHGFSQLDHLCNNVACGGHFLCSVAANGHKQVVKPIRYGERNGHKIICNRQLLIANAFEELIQEKMPRSHRYIRSQYNKVGNVVHRHYHLFSHKWLSDCIYLLMKPLEFVFLITLYTFDQKPENRIARQYVRKRQ